MIPKDGAFFGSGKGRPWRAMHGRSRLGGLASSPMPERRGKGGDGASRSVWRLVHWAAVATFRRRGVLLVVPLLYLALTLVFLGRWEWDLKPPMPVHIGVAVLRRRVPPPGSVYHSSQVFQKLWPYMQADVNYSIPVIIENSHLAVSLLDFPGCGGVGAVCGRAAMQLQMSNLSRSFRSWVYISCRYYWFRKKFCVKTLEY